MNRIKQAVFILGAGATLAAASASACADDRYWQRGHGHGHRGHREVVVVQQHYVPVARTYVIEQAPAVYYAPPPDHAYDSIRCIETQVACGAFVRGLHHWGASAMVAA